MQASSSHGMPYEGYPYVNPRVVDAPSIDAATAARWANLPRRKVTVPTTPGDTPCVVYVDIPENEPTREPVRQETQGQSSSRQPAIPPKLDEDTPVVYIDMPDEENGIELTQSSNQRTTETYVEETIFYNPFDDKRINMGRREGASSADSGAVESDLDSISDVNTPVRVLPSRVRPQRPNYINLTGGPSGSGHSGASSIQSVSSTTPILPTGLPSDGYLHNYPSPESSVASGQTTGFPEPPPAYTEIDLASPQPPIAQTTIAQQPIVQQPRPTELAEMTSPTQVIVSAPMNVDRKYLTCQHCGVRVHTLVVKEIGPLTHLAGLICLVICMLPVVCLIYYLDCLKNKNHYCPNCNKVIGYELPLNRDKVVYIH